MGDVKIDIVGFLYEDGDILSKKDAMSVGTYDVLAAADFDGGVEKLVMLKDLDAELGRSAVLEVKIDKLSLAFVLRGRTVGRLLSEVAALKKDRTALVDALTEILRVTPMGVEAFGIAALVLGELDAWPYAPEAGASKATADAEVEQAARKIYESWSNQPGYVPWVDGGNSTKQDEARRIARNKEPARG